MTPLPSETEARWRAEARHRREVRLLVKAANAERLRTTAALRATRVLWAALSRGTDKGAALSEAERLLKAAGLWRRR